MRLYNNNWRSQSSTIDRISLPERSRRPSGAARLPDRLTEAQRRALPALTDYLSRNPGSSGVEVARGLGWETSTTQHFLRSLRFPFADEDRKSYRYFVHGGKPE